MRITSGQLARLRRNDIGAVVVEYTLLLVFVAIPTITGLVAGGKQMLTDYRAGREAMLKPTP